MRIVIGGLLLFSAISGLHAQTGFDDKSAHSGIFDLGSNHGISFGDFNNDGLEDVYIAVREAGVPNKLYLNKGDLVFEEIAASAGVNSMSVTTAATWGDINNDGFLDLYVGNTDASNTLYLNKGDLTFEDITISAGVGDPFDPRSVQFADVDNDGLLDIYVHNFNTENVLYKNKGDNTFEDVTQESGALNTGPAMGTIFFDMDGDGDQDLYVLNDGETNALFENVGEGKFQDISVGSGLDFHCSCMGVDFGDMDHDGDYDIYVTNFGVNFLFENNGDGTFTDKGGDFDVDDAGMGWGTFWFDFDNDGDQDIYLANHQFISSRPNMLYRNDDDGSSFLHVSSNSNIESPYASFGTASADVNNDGFVDLIVANWGRTARNRLYVNNLEENNSILVKAVGTVSNTSAIGTTITVRTGDKIQMDQITGATGYASQNSLVLHFGFGTTEVIDEMIIKWPSGIQESYTNLPVNKYFTVTEDQNITNTGLKRPVVTSTEGTEPLIAHSFPNPFSTRTFIPVKAGLSQGLRLEIYSADGDRVKVLDVLEFHDNQPGFYWDGTNVLGTRVNSGVYLYKVAADDRGLMKTGRLILNR
ncbi:MAG: hypothetical protein HEP71_24740 [Roseivirga sp.]|nr:hypothetical protein [Roseivirga sp.]